MTNSELEAIVEAGKDSLDGTPESWHESDFGDSLMRTYAAKATMLCNAAPKLAARVKELEARQLQDARDWADDDTAIREACRELLSEQQINGDSHGVPTMVDVALAAIARAKELEAKLQAVRGYIPKLKRFTLDHLMAAEKAAGVPVIQDKMRALADAYACVGESLAKILGD